MDIDTPEDYELAKSRLVVRAVKAAGGAAQEPAFEAAPDREDFAQDGDRHFFGRFRAEREANRAPDAREARRGRHKAWAARPARSF